MKRTNSKARTQIGDISPRGFELTDFQLQFVRGAAKPHMCWEPSASVTNPGEPDTAKDYVPD